MAMPLDLFDGCLDDADELFRHVKGIKIDPINELMKNAMKAEKRAANVRVSGPIWID